MTAITHLLMPAGASLSYPLARRPREIEKKRLSSLSFLDDVHLRPWWLGRIIVYIEA